VIPKVAQPQVPPSKKNQKCTMCVSVCVLTQQDWETEEKGRESGGDSGMVV